MHLVVLVRMHRNTVNRRRSTVAMRWSTFTSAFRIATIPGATTCNCSICPRQTLRSTTRASTMPGRSAWAS